jgi:hypothetical protein
MLFVNVLISLTDVATPPHGLPARAAGNNKDIAVAAAVKIIIAAIINVVNTVTCLSKKYS